MELRPKEFIYKIKEFLTGRVDLEGLRSFTDFDSGYLTAFLGGTAASIILILILSVTGLLGNPFLDSSDSSIDVLPPEEVGNRTVEMLNQRVLHNTPNNVTGELVDVYPADSETLSNFYEVEMMVKNPTSQQRTTVYVKKDASLVFLNHPRYFDTDKYRNQQHQ